MNKKIIGLFAVSGVLALSAVAVAGESGACEGHGGPRGGGFGMRADANKDGKVTLAEALAAGKERFTKKDANKDGAISKDEVKGRGAWLFDKADANKDGKVTQAESETLVKEGFTRFDANKDGTLTQDEMPHRGHHRGGKHKDQDKK